jgi:hypothetical protein
MNPVRHCHDKEMGISNPVRNKISNGANGRDLKMG